MPATRSILVKLTAEQAESLDAIAAACGGDGTKLVTSVVADWIDRLPTQHVAPDKLELARRRLLILKQWWTHRRNCKLPEAQATPGFIQQLRVDGVSVCRASLYEWQIRWERHGLAGLIDARDGRGSKPVHEAFIDTIKQLLTTPKMTLTAAYRMVAAEHKGDKVPTYSAVHRRLRCHKSAVQRGPK